MLNSLLLLRFLAGASVRRRRLVAPHLGSPVGALLDFGAGPWGTPSPEGFRARLSCVGCKCRGPNGGDSWLWRSPTGLFPPSSRGEPVWKEASGNHE